MTPLDLQDPRLTATRPASGPTARTGDRVLLVPADRGVPAREGRVLDASETDPSGYTVAWSAPVTARSTSVDAQAAPEPASEPWRVEVWIDEGAGSTRAGCVLYAPECGATAEQDLAREIAVANALERTARQLLDPGGTPAEQHRQLRPHPPAGNTVGSPNRDPGGWPGPVRRAREKRYVALS